MNDIPEELIQRAFGGDRAALDEVLERYLPRLRAFVRLRAGAVVRGEESTSDLVQSVCRELVEDLPSLEFRGESAFRGWLFTSALRKIQGRHRFYTRDKRDVRRDASQVDPTITKCYQSLSTPSRALMSHEEIALIERSFDRLDPDHQRVIALVRIAGLSHAEAAEHMERTELATRGLLHRALARLAAILASESP